MKSLFSFFLIILFSIQSFAQPKFAISYVQSIELSSFNNFGLIKTGFRLGYTLGTNVRYSLNEKWHITSGIQYSLKGFSSNLTFTDANNNVLGTSTGSFSFRFIEVPLLLSYQSVSDSKFSVYTSAGFVPGYLMSEKITGANGQSPSSKSSTTYNRAQLDPSFTKMIISGYIGMGGMIKMSEKFSLLIQPNFKYALTKLNKFSPPKHSNYFPYSIGLLCGIYYRF